MSKLPIGKIYGGIEYALKAEQVGVDEWKIHVSNVIGRVRRSFFN